MVKQNRTHALMISGIVVSYNVLALAVYEFAGINQSLAVYLLLVLVVSVGTFLIIRFFFKRFVQSYTMSPGKLQNTNNNGNEVADNQVEELKKLREMERYRKDFLGNVSHELKTPIFNIQGYLLTLLGGGLEDESINRLYLKRGEKSINRLISIVEDLDSIARLESGEFKVNPEPFNLVQVLEEVIDYMEMPARQRTIRTTIEGGSKKAIWVKADRKLIVEVIENLVNNSIKYGKQGGKTTIGFVDRGKRILVNITDNGIGIAEKDLPRIFERFFRVDKSRSRESGGTGLGLSIVKHTLHAHQQTITVRSKVGSGSTFTFTLDKAK
jgi:two-component system phosphate regulon sensor histidine kinase PhoR